MEVCPSTGAGDTTYLYKDGPYGTSKQAMLSNTAKNYEDESWR
jgi:hypothetical protein